MSRLRSAHGLEFSALLLLAAILVSSGPPPANNPGLLTPARPDSVSIESEPGPLLVPGQSVTPDSLVRTPRKFAIEQMMLGLAMERAGNAATALMAYGNAVRADSTLPGAAFHYGHLQMRIGKLKEAEVLFRQELRLNPHDRDAARDLGLTLSALKRDTEAIARLRRLTVREPAYDDGWYALGLVYANAGRLHDAEVALRRAIALPPPRALEHRDLGVILGSLKRPREARVEYQKALALDPSDPTIWLNLGNLEARAGRSDSALVAYVEAERRDSTYDLALEGQLRSLNRLERPDDIASVYERWLRLRPDDTDLRLRAVRHLVSLGRVERAVAIGRGGVEFDPRSPANHMIYGMSLVAADRTREALVELRRADALFKDPAGKEQVEKLVASLSSAAPDSLRALFDADSVAHAQP